MTLDPSIFKAYDIRGIVDENLTEEVVRNVGRVLGTWAVEAGRDTFCVGRDGRLSGERLSAALVEGIASAGITVLDIGMAPTPVLYFATHHFGNGTGVAVTGSHNPPEYNGLKMLLAGLTLYGDKIQALREAVEAGAWNEAYEPGEVRRVDVIDAYLEKITSTVKLQRPLKIAIDAGNGVAGPTAERLFKGLGCEVTPLFTDIDGTFPNHHPDPSKLPNLVDLQAAVKAGGLDVGLAFDGDGDRLGVVTPNGRVIFPDRQMMVFSKAVLEAHPGAPIVYDVKCSRSLVAWIRDHGGVPTISRTGHSLVKRMLRETGAPLAGEMSGHIFFNDERWFGFDDGLYAGARLLEILSAEENPGAFLESLPDTCSTPELNVPMTREQVVRVIDAMRNTTFEGASDIITIDGIRVEWPDGFALARPSNTTPVLVLRLEGDTPEALERVRRVFLTALKAADPSIELPL